MLRLVKHHYFAILKPQAEELLLAYGCHFFLVSKNILCNFT